MKPSYSEALLALSRYSRLTDLIHDADENGEVVKEQDARKKRKQARETVCQYMGVPYQDVETV